MKYIIRKAQTADAKAISNLSLQLGHETKVEDSLTRMEIILKLDDNVLYVADFEGQVGGWIQATYCHRLEAGSFVEITGLVVDEGWRGKGVGKALIEEVVTWTKFIGCSSLRVRSNVIRKEAHLFYENLGYTLTKEQKVFDKKIID